MKLQKIEMTCRASRLHRRLIVKAFPDSSAAHEWLNKQDNNDWSEHTGGLKAGKYAYCGGEWRNLKSLPVELLAHM